MGTLLPAVAGALGLSDEVVVSAGSGDNAMSALGAGVHCLLSARTFAGPEPRPFPIYQLGAGAARTETCTSKHEAGDHRAADAYWSNMCRQKAGRKALKPAVSRLAMSGGRGRS